MFYRTIRGFEILIEKEWCSFGHKFTDRTGHLYPQNEKEQAPIFLQFMVCYNRGRRREDKEEKGEEEREKGEVDVREGKSVNTKLNQVINTYIHL